MKYQILPPLSKNEYQVLKDDIASRNQILVPIEFDEEGNVLDGHHRLQIADELGLADYPKTIRHFNNEEEKEAHIYKVNLDRRHLSAVQIKELRERQKQLAKALREQGKTQVEVAVIIGVSQPTIVAWENVSNIGADIANTPDVRITIPKKEYPKILKRLNEGETQEQIAADYHVNRSRIAQIKKQAEHKDKPSPPLPSEKFQVIYSDPPWPIGSIELDKWESPIEDKYPTMTIEQITSLPIPDLAANDCSLFLWTTHTFLEDAFEIIDTWGFKYFCCITWDKGNGWTQNGFHKRTEFLLFAYRGKININQRGKAIPTLIVERKTKHSKKPDSIRDLIKSKTPEPRLEMFGREKHKGWVVWGKDI